MSYHTGPAALQSIAATETRLAYAMTVTPDGPTLLELIKTDGCFVVREFDLAGALCADGDEPPPPFVLGTAYSAWHIAALWERLTGEARDPVLARREGWAGCEGAGSTFGGGAMTLELQPITFAAAKEYIRQHHRHHKPPQGWLFGCAVNDGEKVVGVVVVGRPVARMLQDGYTAEVTRCCTDGTKNACSMLYGAAWRAAKALGYRRLITYTLASESGSSLRSSGWRELYTTGGGEWGRPSRPREVKSPTAPKTLWEAS